MLYGVPVSLQAGGSIPCRLNSAATLLIKIVLVFFCNLVHIAWNGILSHYFLATNG